MGDMPQSSDSDITLGEISRRMDTFQNTVTASIQGLTDKLEQRPSWADINTMRDGLKAEIAFEAATRSAAEVAATAARTTADAAVTAQVTTIQDNLKWVSRTAVTSMLTTVGGVITGIVVFFMTK